MSGSHSCSSMSVQKRCSENGHVLVPMDSEGITIVRPMHVYGYDDGYTGHPELKFENEVEMFEDKKKK